MKIIRDPSVYLVGRQTIDSEVLNQFLADHDVSWQTDSEVAAEVLTETAGRVCYMSFAKPRPGGNQAYLGHIKEVGHGSVLEHAVWNFIFTGVSRTLTHELVRHRIASYSQLSQRYVDESTAEYVEPDIIANDPELHAIWLKSVEQAHQAYVQLAERLALKVRSDAYQEYFGLKTKEGLRFYAMNEEDWYHQARQEGRLTEFRKGARQAARSVLPNATETKIFVTMNARALRHFIEMRASRHAEPEIRKLAVATLNILQREAPSIFDDYNLVPLPDGTCEATTKHRKV